LWLDGVVAEAPSQKSATYIGRIGIEAPSLRSAAFVVWPYLVVGFLLKLAFVVRLHDLGALKISPPSSLEALLPGLHLDEL